MRFVIRHEGKNRLRVHMKQSRMTYEQADVLLYYLEGMEEVVRAQVYSQTADAVICYGKGTDRASVLHALQKFAYQNVEVPDDVLANSGRAMNEEYKEKLVTTTLVHYGKRFLLPYPIRIICDTHLRTPLHAQVVQTAKEVPTWIATAVTDTMKKAQYENLGCRILEVPQKDGHIDLQVLMRLLGEENVDGILLEGGGTLNWSALRAEIVDAVQTYIAPKIFGGTAQSPVEGAGVALPDEGIRLENTRCISCGEDYRIESDVVYICLQES